MGLFDTVSNFLGKAADFGEQVQGGLDVLLDIRDRVSSFGDFGTPSTPSFNPAVLNLPLPDYRASTGGVLTAPPAPSRAPGGFVFVAGLAVLALVVLKR